MEQVYIPEEDPTHRLTSAILDSRYADTLDERIRSKESILEARSELSRYIGRLLQDPRIYTGWALHFYKNIALAAWKAIDRLDDFSTPPERISEEIYATDVF